MMNRRDCLKSIFGVVAAAALAPLVNLQDMTPNFWEHPAITALTPWRIRFTDGTVYAFNAKVTREWTDAEGFHMTLAPRGPMSVYQEAPQPKGCVITLPDGEQVNLGPMPSDRIELGGCSLSVTMTEKVIDGNTVVFAGLKNIGTFTISGNFI